MRFEKEVKLPYNKLNGTEKFNKKHSFFTFHMEIGFTFDSLKE